MQYAIKGKNFSFYTWFFKQIKLLSPLWDQQKKTVDKMI